MAKDLIARIVVDGSPYEWRDAKVVVKTSCSMASELIRQAVNCIDWPSSRVRFTVTPGGFIQAPMPNDHQGLRSWESRPEDFQRLVPFAEKALWQVVDEDIRTKLRQRSRFLTVGVDLVRDGQSKVGGGSDTRAELVGVVDLDESEIVRWTGKSYPVPRQEERVLVQETHLESHLLSVAGHRVLVLGCHDLNVFNGRARANAKNARRKRRRKMETLARRFKPTMVLHHPHQTDSRTIWRQGWSGLQGALAFDGPYASGIAYFPDPKKSSKARGHLDDVLRKTAGGGVSDIRVDGFWSAEWQRY